MTKTLVLLLGACMVLLSGCEDPCKTGLKLKTDLMTLELGVTGTITTPDSFDLTCQRFSTIDKPMLLEGSRFALRTADHVLSWDETRCTFWTTEMVCPSPNMVVGAWQNPMQPNQGGGFDPFNGQWMHGYCHHERVCAHAETINHLRDGHDEALALSTDLTSAAGALSQACVDHAADDTAKALLGLAETKGDLHDAIDNAEAVLQKAGCYSRRGD